MRNTLIKELLNEFGFGGPMGAAGGASYTASQLSGVPNEEEAEVGQVGGQQRKEVTPKIDKARALFKGLIGNPDTSRAEIITAFETQLGVSNSTAVSYYQRLAKEAGLTNLDAEDSGMSADSGKSKDDSDSGGQGYDPTLQLPDEELDLNDEVPDSGDPDKQGVIRVVPNAHLVYKRENEEGTYDELWVYNTDADLKNELAIRRNILAGTDIPPKKTKSEDGQQSFELTTMGNAQMLNITGLPQ